MIISPTQGVIIAYGPSASPREKIETNTALRQGFGDDIQPPPLSTWSDVAALNLRNLLNQEPQQQFGGQTAGPKLRYIFCLNADGSAMQRIVQGVFDEYNKVRAKGQTPAGFGRWPQYLHVTADSPAGQMIVASEIGLRVSKLLYENKEWLGTKQVKGIAMFRDDGERSGTAFMFEIMDVVQPKRDTGEVVKRERGPNHHTRGAKAQQPSTRAKGSFNLELQSSTAARAKSLLLHHHLLSSTGELESDFTDPRDLAAYGWSCTRSKTVDSFSSTGQVPLRSAIKSLGLSQEGARPKGQTKEASGKTIQPDVAKGQNHAVECIHDRKAKLGDQIYEPTNAKYNMVINPTEGLIIAYGRRDSPKYMLATNPKLRKKYGPDTQPTPLGTWSDVVGLNLRELAGNSTDNRKQITGKLNLTYVFHIDADFAPMPAVVKQALRNADPAKFGRWSRRLKLKAGSRAGQTIVGSTVGLSVSMLLISHKEWFGVQRVKSVTIFDDDHKTQPRLAFLFEIENVDQPRTGPVD
ncbi:hypothetical protein LTR86_009874 [Recurvomyces mirabilis]|nr:hypothetical protein LTR86_009874 [Recurvomyces mirabilis]